MTRIVLAIMLAFTIQPIAADVLLIDEVRQSARMQLPVNGESKADVSAKFGAPTKKNAEVGDPPISSWDYAEYSVYFEYDLVLFTVLHAGAVIENSTEE